MAPVTSFTRAAVVRRPSPPYSRPVTGMTSTHPQRMKVECTDCEFETIVRADDDELPADAVREHGDETGHTMRVFACED